MNMAFAETNPGPMKAVMDMVGVDAPRMLAPLVQPAQALVSSFRAEFKKQLALTENVG
jgi:4-hydroxy-tetrahydrodipicolinate synthase